MSTKGCFTLRWRSPPVMNSEGILKFDCLRVTLLSSGGLHYGQESLGGELCTWMNDMVANMAALFWKESSPEVKFLGQPQSLGQETWHPGNFNFNKIFLLREIFALLFSLFSMTFLENTKKSCIIEVSSSH